jgi:hypothetical protein
VIGVGVIAGTLVFVLIDRHFQQLFDRWRITRHLAAASRISAALCSSHRDAAIVLACSLVIHLITAAAAWCCAKAIRFTGQFRADSVPLAAGAFDRDFAGIDSWLGCS